MDSVKSAMALSYRPILASTVPRLYHASAASHRSPVFCGSDLPRQSKMLRSQARMNLVSTCTPMTHNGHYGLCSKTLMQMQIETYHS